MKKNAILIMMLLMTIFAGGISAYAADAIQVVLDGKRLTFDVSPTVSEEGIMVPVRKIFESARARVAWNEAEETVTVSKEDKTLVLHIGSTQASVNGEEFLLEKPPVLINGRTMVPAGLLVQVGMKADLDAEKNTIHITSLPMLALSDSYYENQKGNFKIKLIKGWTIVPEYTDQLVRVDVTSDLNANNSMSIVSSTNEKGLDLEKAIESILDEQILSGMKEDLSLKETKREKVKTANEQEALWVELTGVYDKVERKIFILFTVNESSIQAVQLTSYEPYATHNLSVIKESLLSLSAIK